MMTRRAFLILFLLLPTLAFGADKTITQKTVAEAQIDRLTVNAEAGVVTARATYHVVDAAGKQIGGQRWIVIALTPGQITTLRNFVVNVVVPAVNAAEGM